MKLFGPLWEDYHQKIANNWNKVVTEHDIVLIAGDISWAMKLEEAMQDLDFIDKLRGTKILIRGNHDYWWPSLSKLQKLPFKTLHFIQNNAVIIQGVGFCGTRLWDSDEFSFSDFVQYKENPKAKVKEPVDDKKIFESELARLKLSIAQLPKDISLKIALVHYPPIGKDLKSTACSKIFEESGISHVCFGHLHNLKKKITPYGSARGVTYHFSACDEVDFTPQLILDLDAKIR